MLMMASPANVAGQALVRSERSDEECYVRFINKTKRNIDVIWIDFGARFIKYTLLKDEQFIDVNTYKNNYWIAVDSETKDGMLLNGKFRYDPQTSREFFMDRLHRERQWLPEKLRIIVRITLPLYSLYFRTLLAIRNLVRDEEDVEKLGLARHVKEELKRVVRRRNDNYILTPRIEL